MPEVGCVVGRKRTSVKRDLKLWVDGKLIDDLNHYKENKSELFSKAAEKRIEELKKEDEQKD